jgi:hypothetical protein
MARTFLISGGSRNQTRRSRSRRSHVAGIDRRGTTRRVPNARPSSRGRSCGTCLPRYPTRRPSESQGAPYRTSDLPRRTARTRRRSICRRASIAPPPSTAPSAPAGGGDGGAHLLLAVEVKPDAPLSSGAHDDAVIATAICNAQDVRHQQPRRLLRAGMTACGGKGKRRAGHEADQPRTAAWTGTDGRGRVPFLRARVKKEGRSTRPAFNYAPVFCEHVTPW